MDTKFVELLQKKSDDTKHINFSFDDIEVTGRKSLRIGDELYGLSDSGLESFVEVLEIPKPYAKRCPDELFMDNVNFWLKDRRDTAFSALVENNVIRNFVKPEYPYIPFADVWSEVEAALGSDFEIANSTIGEDFVSVVALTPRHETEIVDSVVQGGMQFTYSDSWTQFPDFSTYLYRLICSNGMTHPVKENIKFRVSGKSYTEIFGTMKTFVNKAVDNLGGMIHGLEALNDDSVTNIVAVIKRICDENGLPKKIREALIEAASTKAFLQTIPDEQITTMYDIINLVTYVGSHNRDISEDHRQHLLNIGGNAAVNHATRCSSCGSATV